MLFKETIVFILRTVRKTQINFVGDIKSLLC